MGFSKSDSLAAVSNANQLHIDSNEQLDNVQKCKNLLEDQTEQAKSACSGQASTLQVVTTTLASNSDSANDLASKPISYSAWRKLIELFKCGECCDFFKLNLVNRSYILF